MNNKIRLDLTRVATDKDNSNDTNTAVENASIRNEERSLVSA